MVKWAFSSCPGLPFCNIWYIHKISMYIYIYMYIPLSGTAEFYSTIKIDPPTTWDSNPSGRQVVSSSHTVTVEILAANIWRWGWVRNVLIAWKSQNQTDVTELGKSWHAFSSNFLGLNHLSFWVNHLWFFVVPTSLKDIGLKNDLPGMRTPSASSFKTLNSTLGRYFWVNQLKFTCK